MKSKSVDGNGLRIYFWTDGQQQSLPQLTSQSRILWRPSLGLNLGSATEAVAAKREAKIGEARALDQDETISLHPCSDFHHRHNGAASHPICCCCCGFLLGQVRRRQGTLPQTTRWASATGFFKRLVGVFWRGPKLGRRMTGQELTTNYQP